MFNPALFLLRKRPFSLHFCELHYCMIPSNMKYGCCQIFQVGQIFCWLVLTICMLQVELATNCKHSLLGDQYCILCFSCKCKFERDDCLAIFLAKSPSTKQYCISITIKKSRKQKRYWNEDIEQTTHKRHFISLWWLESFQICSFLKLCSKKYLIPFLWTWHLPNTNRLLWW